MPDLSFAAESGEAPGSFRQHQRLGSAVDSARLPDLAIMMLLLLFGLLSTVPAVRQGGPPAEDAAMLLRYSQHLAQGHGITWNIGEHPVEGATDFLYMVAIAGITKLTHLDIVSACRILLLTCALLLPQIVFNASRFVLGANRWLAAALGVYLASIPYGGYINACFSAPFMMLVTALTATVAFAFIAERTRPNAPASILFSVLALLMGLTRPEGNVLAALLLAAVCFSLGLRRTRVLVVSFLAVFLIVGGTYFTWRVHYFGYLLPNPFYVKGGGHLHIDGLYKSAEKVVKFLWPTWPFALLALRSPQRTRQLLALLIPVGGFTVIWVLLSNENNHLFRFQATLVPVMLLALPLLLENVFAELPLDLERLHRGSRRGLVLAAVLYTAAVSYTMFRSISSPIVQHNAQQFAGFLARYQDRGYTMATTEAGTFPYYSKWNAIDLLGLNDATIAHQGLSAAYLDRYKPELILYHLYTPGSGGRLLMQAGGAIDRRNMNAIRIAHDYAKSNDYILAAAYGSEPCSRHYFYIRPNTPDTDAIVHYLRTTQYLFLDTGKISTDFRDQKPPDHPECSFPAGLDH